MTPARRPFPVVGPALVVLFLLYGRHASGFGAGGLERMQMPRAEALGGAGCALEHDANLVLTNPAAAARVVAPSICVGAQTGWLGGGSGTVFGVHPVAIGAVTAGALFTDAGQVTLNASDGSSRQVDAGRDLLLVGGLAGPLAKTITMGCTFQLYRSELAEVATAQTILVDVGIQDEVSQRLKLGLAARRFGPAIRYLDDPVAPPAVVCAGAAYGLPLGAVLPELFSERERFVAVADLEASLVDSRPAVKGGAEFWWGQVLILRVGGRATNAQALGNLAAGFGLRTPLAGFSMRELRLDYAVRLLNSAFNAPQNLSLTALF